MWCTLLHSDCSQLWTFTTDKRIVYNPVFGFLPVLILWKQSTNGTGNSKPDQIHKFHDKSLGSFCEIGRLGGHFSAKTWLKLGEVVPLFKKER